MLLVSRRHPRAGHVGYRGGGVLQRRGGVILRTITATEGDATKEGGEARTHTHKASRARKPLVWEKRFFEALREVGTITHACRAAQIARRTWYDAVARRPYLLDMEADALDAFADLLEREATRSPPSAGTAIAS